MGEIGIKVLASGRVQATARMRDEAGALCRLKATEFTEGKARLELERQAQIIRIGTAGELLSPRSTLAQACAVWLVEKERSGSVEDSTMEAYHASVNNVLVPMFGQLMLSDVTALRVNRIVQQIREEKSLSAARKARSVLSQVCATGIEHGVLQINPVRHARSLPLPERKESVLTPEQLGIVRDLIRGWRLANPGHGPRPNARLLENVMWIMVGTSARIGEVLGMQRADVDVTTVPATAKIAATIRYTKKQGLHRKPSPKRLRQRRRVALPTLAAEAVRDQLVLAGPEADAYLFATKTGRPLSVSNVERLLRTFAAENEPPLRRAGIDVDEFTTHLFRRTAATIVESVAGISLASRMLGHANEQVTRNSYVVTAELVDPLTAEILDSALRGLT
ncbi:tyrosine-type recombinase/integrase [Microbacterium sp. AZCO]|uniref:tyrosine-type recombinase/integrase n=1 Tax=Microbacterium sp. AZCO TaxID=3142976 RepID=UPI0031F3DAE8